MNKNTKQLLNENNQFETSLTKEHQTIMTDIVCYIRSFDISMMQQEMVRKDIIHMLLDAQNNNQTSQEVLGEDFQQFCDDIIQELPRLSKKEKVMIEIGSNILYINIFLVIMFFTKSISMISNTALFPMMTIRISELFQIVVMIAVANFIVQFLCKSAFRSMDKKVRWLIIGGFALTIVSVVIGTMLFDSITFDVHMFAFLILILLLYFIQNYISRKYE